MDWSGMIGHRALDVDYGQGNVALLIQHAATRLDSRA